MRALLHRLVSSLVRPRDWGRPRVRVGRTGRSSRAGVALLLAISLLALMTVMTTEIVHSAGVRIRMAANQRDEAKAEALAYGGVQFYRLILMASAQLDRQFGPMLAQYGSAALGMPVNQLWQIVPRLSTSLLRLVLVTDGKGKKMEQATAGGELAQDLVDASREKSTSLKKAFLDFDGDFSVTVEDEDRRIFVGNVQVNSIQEAALDPRLAPLIGMMNSPDAYDFLRDINIPWQYLVGGLIDWVDPDDDRADMGGRESAIYQRLEDPYLPKNAPFESVEEIRLVDGWHRDDVWRKFGRNLTVYGTGRINVNTADRRVLSGLVRQYTNPPLSDAQLDLLWQSMLYLRTGSVMDGAQMLNDPRQFIALVQSVSGGAQVDPRLEAAIDTRSHVFRVKSVGKVGDAEAEIEMVLDFRRDPRAGKVVYWRVR